MLPVEPPKEWRVVVEGEAKRASVDDTESVLEGRGEKTDIEVELTSRSRHDLFYYSDGETFPLGDDADRYEVATRVKGTATVGDRTHSFEGVGERKAEAALAAAVPVPIVLRLFFSQSPLSPCRPRN